MKGSFLGAHPRFLREVLSSFMALFILLRFQLRWSWTLEGWTFLWHSVPDVHPWFSSGWPQVTQGKTALLIGQCRPMKLTHTCSFVSFVQDVFDSFPCFFFFPKLKFSFYERLEKPGENIWKSMAFNNSAGKKTTHVKKENKICLRLSHSLDVMKRKFRIIFMKG